MLLKLRSKYRPTTLTWGITLIGTGVVLLLISMGLHLSMVTLITLTLGVFGGIALLLGVLPRPQAPTATDEVSESEIFSEPVDGFGGSSPL